MKATDLRIGNYFHWNRENEKLKDELIRVYNITRSTIRAYTNIEELDEIQLYYCDIKPIPITEEWLIDFGFMFDYTNTGDRWINLQTNYLELMPMPDGFYPVYAQPPELSSESEQRVGLQRINYIHQLQNLFYALTGSEL